MKKLYAILFLIIIISCNSPKKKLIEINPKKFTENLFTLSQIADDISYIPLDNSFSMGIIYSIRIYENEIYISIKDIGLTQFNKHGKLVKKIVQKGNGPGELRYNGSSFTLNQKRNRIYVVDNGKINIYSHEGIFLEQILIGEYIEGRSENIEMLGPNLFIPDYGTNGNYKYNWIIIDTLGNLISKKESLFNPNGFIQKGCTYKFKDNVFYYDLLNDTIFSILPNLQFSGSYLFSQGDFRWPKEGINFSVFREKAYDMFRPFSMFETNHYIFIHYGYHDKSAILLIEKKSNKIYQAFKNEERGILKFMADITNDLDGGLSVSPRPVDISYYAEKDKEYIVTLIYPVELKNYVASNEFINKSPKYPEKKKELVQLAKSLHENDNPVLMLVKLKK